MDSPGHLASWEANTFPCDSGRILPGLLAGHILQLPGWAPESSWRISSLQRSTSSSVPPLKRATEVTFVLQVLVLLRPPHSLILVSNTTETAQLEKATVKDHQGVSAGKMPKIWKWMPFPIV